VFDTQKFGTIAAEEIGPSTREPALAVVIARSAPEFVDVARGWLDSGLDGNLVFRGPTGEVEALAGQYLLSRDNLVDTARFDPLAASVLDYVDAHGGLRDAARVSYARFYLPRAGSEYAVAARNALNARSAVDFLRTPLAWSFAVIEGRDDERSRRWELAMAYWGFFEIPELAFAHGRHRFKVVAMDWRRTTRTRWLELLADRELVSATEPSQLRPPRDLESTSLPEAEFRDAVRAALKELSYDDRLARSPLVRARVAGGDVARLRAVIREAAETLRAHPRDEKLWRALHASCLDGVETQELAAERLDLPLSTFRRHLSQAIDRVADWLWERERR
jgi:hypothetical protein